MSNITLSASVRQNLLSLQSTADLLSQTQNRLATGNKVNSALDNPTNYFTAQSLNSRASDISNLLDSIGNGVQVLQAANTGITSLQKLVSTAQSIANQALQTTSGYSSKATDTITGTGTGSGAADASNIDQGKLTGAKLTFKTAAGGTVNVTLGSTYSALSSGSATVKSLSDLNQVLSDAGISLTASVDGTTADQLDFTSTNDAAGQVITGTGTAPTAADAVDITAVNNASTPAAIVGTIVGPVADAASQSQRASLVTQYNQVLQQIKTTAQDASFNGVNLLNGDQLKLVFNETGKSTLNIAGVTDDPTGLGLANLTSGTDFTDNKSTNAVLTALNNATTTLSGQASSLGSNLSIVQIRQDFSKNLINVLQTGASNLTLSDSNEDAADSQALSTRQSIAVSALALANQSQQGVLRLLQ
jgi:flagellin-like hook-associated protein FlgL